MPPRRPSRPVDDGPTLIDALARPERIVGAKTLTDVSSPYSFLDDDEPTIDEPTVYRGDRPPKPSSSRRLSPALMKLCQRRREEIGLTFAQLAKLTGIDQEELERFEATGGNHRLVYDHAVVLARALGLKASELPGLRLVMDKEDKSSLPAAYDALVAAYSQGPVITFEGKSGERYGGDVTRLGGASHFALKISDASLGSEWPKGALLGFVMEDPRHNDVAMIRQKRGKHMALRRLVEKTWTPLSRWQPPYSIADWEAFARLQVVLPRY